MRRQLSRFARCHPILFGTTLMIIGCGFITLNDAIMKSVVDILPIGQILFLRSIGSIFLLTIFGILMRRRYPMIPRSRIDVTKHAIMLLIGLVVFPVSLRYINMTESIVLIYTSPIIVAILSPWILSEKSNHRQWLSAATGFIGAYFVINPHESIFNPAYILPLIVAVSNAARDMLSRRISVRESPFTIILAGTILTTLVSSVSILFEWKDISIYNLSMILFCGIILAIGHVISFRAFNYASASIISNIKYSSIIWSILMSYIFFSDVLPAKSGLGAALIIISGIAIVSFRNKEASSVRIPASRSKQ